MTHCVMAMLVATLLQPPAKPQPAPDVNVTGPGSIVLNERNFPIENPAATHPDIRVAEARVMEAQAVLDQVKLKVATDAAMNQAKYDQAKADAATKTKEFERLDAIFKSGEGNNGQHALAAAELQTAKRQLAIAELLTQATKPAAHAPKRVVNEVYDESVKLWLNAAMGQTPTQFQPLQDLLQRKVKFDVKPSDEDQTVIGVLERVMKEWDFAGAKVIVRYPHDTDRGVRSRYTVQPVYGENTIGVWLMMLLDDYNSRKEQLKGEAQGKYQIYVREYGLLFTQVKNAPDGAPTLAEFLRQSKK